MNQKSTTSGQSKYKMCPMCGGKNIHTKEQFSHFTEVTWADGLGSPGSMAMYDTVSICEDCGESWI